LRVNIFESQIINNMTNSFKIKLNLNDKSLPIPAMTLSLTTRLILESISLLFSGFDHERELASIALTQQKLEISYQILNQIIAFPTYQLLSIEILIQLLNFISFIKFIINKKKLYFESILT
jgi:hypothetical protein